MILGTVVTNASIMLGDFKGEKIVNRMEFIYGNNLINYEEGNNFMFVPEKGGLVTIGEHTFTVANKILTRAKTSHSPNILKIYLR